MLACRCRYPVLLVDVESEDVAEGVAGRRILKELVHRHESRIKRHLVLADGLCTCIAQARGRIGLLFITLQANARLESEI